MPACSFPALTRSDHRSCCLHEFGSDEHELAAHAADVVPGSPALGIRDTVPLDGGLGFFHRIEDRKINKTDITARVSVLAGVS